MVSTSIFYTMIMYIFNVLKEKSVTYLYCDAEIVSSNHPVLMLNETMNHLNQQDLRSKTAYLNVSFELHFHSSRQHFFILYTDTQFGLCVK